MAGRDFQRVFFIEDNPLVSIKEVRIWFEEGIFIRYSKAHIAF